MPTRPLQGILVIALEQAVAAPLATRHLADLGARVIKIERPDVGDFAGTMIKVCMACQAILSGSIARKSRLHSTSNIRKAWSSWNGYSQRRMCWSRILLLALLIDWGWLQ